MSSISSWILKTYTHVWIKNFVVYTQRIFITKTQATAVQYYSTNRIHSCFESRFICISLLRMPRFNTSDCGVHHQNCLFYSHKWNTENPPKKIYFCMCASRMKTQLNTSKVRPSKWFISRKIYWLKNMGLQESRYLILYPGNFGAVVYIYIFIYLFIYLKVS